LIVPRSLLPANLFGMASRNNSIRWLEVSRKNKMCLSLQSFRKGPAVIPALTFCWKSQREDHRGDWGELQHGM
jgi:hypothetical protein